MSEERCEGCGSTCVCCCTCEDELICEWQTCPPFETTTLSITKLWFGAKHGWLTYDEAVARGFRDPDARVVDSTFVDGEEKR